MAEGASPAPAPAPPAPPSIIIEDLPLCEGIAPERNGVLKVHSVEPLKSLRDRLEGVFSVVLYYVSKQTTYKTQLDEFKKTPYYKGVLHMLRIVHREGGPFRNWGFVLYTDSGTINFLQSVFPFSQFPKLCLVVVDWPFYNNSAGFVDTSILRCLRFQVVDLFPTQICLIRDADTLFQRVLNETLASDENVTKAIEAWEAHFLMRWLTLENHPPIVIGTSIMYKKVWHVNTPLALAFPYNLQYTYPEYLSQKEVVFGTERENPIFGVLAGFVNIAADKSNLQGVWKQCIEYLQTRFFMARFPYKYKYRRYISNSFSSVYYGAKDGKDEKCILFVMCRYYLPFIYFYDVHYSAETSLGRTEEKFAYLVENTQNIKNAHLAKDRGYTNENKVVKVLKFKGIPEIIVTTRDKRQWNGTFQPENIVSQLLNPASIDFVFDSAQATLGIKDFMRQKNVNKGEEVLPLHETYHRKMKYAMDAYELWLAKYPHAEIYETLKQQLKNFTESPGAKGVKEDINNTSDDLFLKSAGIYSLPEETFFAEKYKADKIAKNDKKAKQASNELAAAIAAASGGVPGAEVDPKGGFRRTLKRRIRQKKTRRTK